MKWELNKVFENLNNNRSESNRAIVGEVGAVTLLRNRLNKCMLPRRRISAGNKNEAKKKKKKKNDKEQVPVHQQIPSEIWQECHQGLKPCLSLKNKAPQQTL